MNEQTFAILIFGGVVVAFGLFGSYMADRQKEREKRERVPGHSDDGV